MNYCGLSPKFCYIIFHHGGATFANFLKPQALQITTKADLYEVLSYYRDRQQCAHAICRGRSLSLSHKSSPESFQTTQILIMLPDLRAHPNVAFPITQRISPLVIRQLMKASSILAYTNAMADKAGSISKDSADGYLARKIMSTGLVLASPFDECQQHRKIFVNVVEWLVRRILVHEGAPDLEKKERSAFYEKSPAFMGPKARITGKSLKHLS